jgi:hypothetical protein
MTLSCRVLQGVPLNTEPRRMASLNLTAPNIIQICIALRWGYVLRNALLGDFVIV